MVVDGEEEGRDVVELDAVAEGRAVQVGMSTGTPAEAQASLYLNARKLKMLARITLSGVDTGNTWPVTIANTSLIFDLRRAKRSSDIASAWDPGAMKLASSLGRAIANWAGV